MRTSDSILGVAAGALATFVLSVALVGLRGELAPEIIVLLLALMVVVVGRMTDRVASTLSAFVAATSFDFFFTKPYLTLRIANAKDIEATIVLLAVAAVAGGTTARTRREKRIALSHDMDVDAIRRVLDVAGERSVEDVELAVRAELLKLLDLSDCSFTTAPVAVPELGATGGLPHTSRLVHRREGFQLPQSGVAIPVTAAGERVGALVCTPIPDVGVDLPRRRTAVALAHILGLAIVAGAGSSPSRKASNG
ncbi:MAG TPA: DUF4118 domain-containing protein [Acidimicrobiales bacterium]|nr:DUF4118 domain-containing protein [Acidimicrobiales bacterium]